MDPFGISFSPGGQNGPNGQPLNGQRPTPVQQAIQTLSLRIPRVAGASAFTAQPLLDSQGSAGLGGNPNSAAMLEQLRRMLFGGADQNGTGVTGMSPDPGGAPDLANIFRQIFGQPQGLPRDNSPLDAGPSAGSGAPMGDNGSGAPLPTPGPSFPNPRFDPGKDRKDLNLVPGTTPLDAPPIPNYTNQDTQQI